MIHDQTGAAAGPIPASEVERNLLRHIMPEAIAATKASYGDDAWAEGSARSLLHDCWLLRTSDPEKKQGDTYVIRFDSVIGGDGFSLLDPASSSDRLTKRLCILTAITTGFKQSKLSGKAASQLSRHLDWFLRWRLSRGHASNSALGPRDFNAFREALAGGGNLALVPIHSRLDRLTASVRSGEREFPTTLLNGRWQVNWPPLAAMLGVTIHSISRSRDFRAELVDKLPMLCPERASELAANIAAESPGLGRESNSARNVEGMLEAWTCLSHLSLSGVLRHDPLCFDPYAETSAKIIAATIGDPRRRTGTLLPPDFFRLLAAAARCVVEYAEHIIEAMQTLRELQSRRIPWRDAAPARLAAAERLAERAPPGLPYICLSWRNEDGSGGGSGLEDRLSVAEAVTLLMTACAVIIGGFAARRVGEVTSLRAGCMEEVEPGIWGLSIYIEKTLRDLDIIPVPTLVRTAVSVLERLTAETRALTGEQWLFRVLRSKEGAAPQYITFRMDEQLNAFARTFSLAPPVGFATWSFASHQLRRGFAILYYHGYLFASMDDLSHHLRHSDSAMTRIYVYEILAGRMGELREDISARTRIAVETMSPEVREAIRRDKGMLADMAERGAIFAEVRCEALVHELLQCWRDEEMPGGKGAARVVQDLASMVEASYAEIRIGSRANDPDAVIEPLTRRLRDHARTHHLDPVPGVPVHCAAIPGNEEDLASAECLKLKRELERLRPGLTDAVVGDRQPDHAFSSDMVCLECVHCVCLADDRKRIAEKEDRLGAAAASNAHPAGKEDAEERYRRYKLLARSSSSASGTAR